MTSATPKPPPPDQPQRDKALDPSRSVLVQAPAGSGKTDLLTRRFLRLLGEVDDPSQIVAITFTNAAAAEMRNRILSELEKAAVQNDGPQGNEFSMESLARRALQRSATLGWKLLDLPAQLRIATIDSFCRDLALQQPLLSTLGGGLDIYDQPAELYRRAARRTMEKLDETGSVLGKSIESLLLWRDNNWQEMEELLVSMLGKRDKWMQGFVLGRAVVESELQALRLRLERPFANALRQSLSDVSSMLDRVPGAREEALNLARFACEEPGKNSPHGLAECTKIPSGPILQDMEEAREFFVELANFLQTLKGEWRSEKGLNVNGGFPATPRGKAGKARFAALISSLDSVSGLESALAAVGDLPQARYTDEEWEIVKSCFTLLRHAAAELQVVFAEAGAADFIEVAQIAQHVLRNADGEPTDAALAVSDGIRHLLVDEFQDTSRRQHQLLSSLVAAWPERTGRTCFLVGDPMQSIYFFRDADAELFRRVKESGLEIPGEQPLRFDSVALSANFRTAPALVDRLNQAFGAVFAADDGSGVTFFPARSARDGETAPAPHFNLHLNFVPQNAQGQSSISDAPEGKEASHAAQTAEIVALIQSHQERLEEARAQGGKYRIAVLGRARSALAPIAKALREAAIPFRAVDLEKLAACPEVLDVLALARALLNPMDRVAWLGVLRAPWCGLTLDSLHRLTSADDRALLDRPVPELLAERLPLLDEEERRAAQRVLGALNTAPMLRAAQPGVSLGTWLEQVWLRLGGADCVAGAGLANLDLLWNCLDRLPGDEQDLLGPALGAALNNLTAQPDPAASAECGVQLMTIHKSKGLEFEVVIVPDLQACGGKTGHKMLSWLERGLPDADESGEITEFLIAPFQPKGEERGSAKTWVDRVYRQREEQEMRRILYVAATRAREQLHLFARPACKVESNGTLTLQTPVNSLLATAWPALEDEVRARFADWMATQAKTDAPEEQVIERIAAAGESNLLVMPPPARPTHLRRLPPDYRPAPGETLAQQTTGSAAADMLRAPSFSRPFAERVGSHEPQPVIPPLYSRHQGGLISRSLGIAVHTLLEELTRLRVTLDWEPAQTALERLAPRIAAQIRAAGIEPVHAANIAAQAFRHALNASHDPVGQWILSPHADAASEASWAGVVAGSVRTVRVDRVFRAGLTPEAEGEDCWWIIDYKTAHAEDAEPAAALPSLRRIFAPQVEAYATVLRKLHGRSVRIHAGLYYPRMLQFDWWEP